MGAGITQSSSSVGPHILQSDKIRALEYGEFHGIDFDIRGHWGVWTFSTGPVLETK